MHKAGKQASKPGSDRHGLQGLTDLSVNGDDEAAGHEPVVGEFELGSAGKGWGRMVR